MSDVWVVNIPWAADGLKALRMAGFHLYDEVVRSALQGIGETWE